MKTYLLKTDQGVCTGFEISNNFLGTGAIARFINRVSDCKIITKRKMFSGSEVHVIFMYKENEFQVWEPFGDNSRLHIGSESKVSEEIILSLVNAIKETRNYFI